MEENKGQETARRYATLLAAACALLILLGSLAVYKIITKRLLRISLENLTELSLHNELAMEAKTDARWESLSAIASHLNMQTISNTEDLLLKLSTTRAFIDCLSLVLVAEDGRTAGANFVLGEDEALAAACKWGGDKFVRLMASPRAATQGHSLDMVYGVKTKPIEVDGAAYTYIVARMDMDDLQAGMKIDCYNGKGRVRIIDSDGSYVVNADRNRNPVLADNFFDIAAASLPKGWSMERLHDLMDRRQAFQAEWSDHKGSEKCLISVIPMNDTPWFFIMKAPVSVFMEQSKSLLSVIVVFMALSFAVVAGAGILMFRMTERLLHAERKHRKELANALSLADQASRAKTTFLNNMSHDMRTPMNAIIGYTALASSRISNTKQVKSYLDKISQSSDHLLSLINDVLDMSRIESGKVNIEEKPESLSDILHHIRNIVLADIHSKSLDFFIDTASVTDENVICDKLHLTQVLLNLMGNAMKFTPPGGTVSLKVTEMHLARETERATYEFRVRDTGIGMAEDFIGKVFEPFSREKNSTVSGIEGTGLGLPITKNLVEMMGGTISLKSEKGKGSEFTVVLTFNLAGKTQDIESIPELVGKRALVVDDDIETCQSVSQMLRLMGLRSEWTMRGKEAVVRVEEAEKLGDPYKVFIIDWLMPDMNGVEAARRIRRLSSEPIIMLSAYDWTDMEDEAKEAGVTDFMSKPLFITETREVLLRCLGFGGKTDEALKDEGGAGYTVSKMGRGERLLLVEDNELNREIACEILQDAGFKVDTAGDGTDAVRMMAGAKPGQYAAILMDVQMPIMDGYEATRRIRALDDPLVAAVPIIALTANVFEEDKEKAFASGMDAYMGKPISPMKILEMLREVMGKWGHSDGLEQKAKEGFAAGKEGFATGKEGFATGKAAKGYAGNMRLGSHEEN